MVGLADILPPRSSSWLPCRVPPTHRSAAQRTVLIPLMLVTVAGCAPLYGANFDYPDPLPLPQSVTAVLSDEGSDDDDPMRSRQQVVDSPNGSATTLAEFYRRSYPASDGWTEVEPEGDQKLCLVNWSQDRYTELVEVFPYGGSRVEQRPGRYLAMISRFQDPGDAPCGLALRWVDLDLMNERDDSGY